MYTLTVLKNAHRQTHQLLSDLRARDTNTPHATQSLDAAIEHVEAALNALRVGVEVENNRMIDRACKMGV